MKKAILLLTILSYFLTLQAQTTLRLGSLFGDHMVLQQNMPAPIWGWTEALQKVEVEMNGEKVNIIADSAGKWQVELTQHKAGGPYKMVIKSKETITLTDVYVGEVWLCSGQSNMDMTVAREDRYWCGVYNEAEEVTNANYPQIRFFDAAFTTKDDPQETVEGKWEVCSPQTIGHLSAAAYFFGRELFKKYNVPIGLITSAYGASTAEAWTSRPYLESNKDFQFLLDKYAEKCAVYDTSITDRAKYKEAYKKWEKDAEKAKAEGKDAPREPKNPNPRDDQHSPCVLYNGMIAPLIPYAIRGAIWYQGESNYPTAGIYDDLMETLIYNWREDWQQGDFPFIYVQLANHQKRVEEPVKDDPMVLVRDKQLKNLYVRNTAMVVAIDNANPENPDDIHPKNKQEIGRRLAIAAMGKVYNEGITYMGPIFSHMIINNDKAILFFDHVGEGFEIKGDDIKGFAIAGADKQFVWGKAIIDGNKIIVTSDKVKKPVYVRYGWSKNPEVNVYNKAELPASPFRTDDL